MTGEQQLCPNCGSKKIHINLLEANWWEIIKDKWHKPEDKRWTWGCSDSIVDGVDNSAYLVEFANCEKCEMCFDPKTGTPVNNPMQKLDRAFEEIRDYMFGVKRTERPVPVPVPETIDENADPELLP